MVKKTVFIILILVLPAAIFAEGSLTLDMAVNNLIFRTPDTAAEDDYYWAWMTSGAGGFSFESEGNRNVKSELQFSFNYPELAATLGYSLPIVTLDKAYVKARFPLFRITAGKTRLSWGEGFMFNSGDLLFGSTGTSVDLTADELRTETTWLTAVNVPLGRFSFIEAVALTPETSLITNPVSGAVAGISYGDIAAASAGGRIYTKVLDIKTEAGYLYSGSSTDAAHRFYVSFQGNLFTDWYLTAGSAVSSDVEGDELTESFKDNLSLSGGIFYMQQINSISTVTFRLEGLYSPFGDFEETPWETGSDAPAYGVYLYPEIVYAPSDTLSISARSVFSPADLSAEITAGVGWNVFEGFTLFAYLLSNAGDGDDTFSWERDRALTAEAGETYSRIAVSTGISYIY